MQSRCLRYFALITTAIATHVSCAEDIVVRGRVVDQQGMPVASASVAKFWRANGTGKKPNGAPLDLGDTDQLLEFWGHIGEMEPSGGRFVKTESDGTFTVRVHSRTRIVMAMNQSRSHGGMAKIPEPYNYEPLQVELVPLIRVHGQLSSQISDKPSKWSHLYVELEEDPARPLGIGRVVGCGSFDGRFEFRLPAGVYVLNAYGVSDPDGTDDIDLHVDPAPRIELKESVPELDLGTLALIAAPPLLDKLKRESSAQGRWRDYTKHYGEPPPNWNVTDAQGISKNTRVSDFLGKWLLIDFWGMSCAPCLSKGIPQIVEFYENHKSSRDKFEVIGVCIDFSGDITSISQLNTALEPIEKHVWNGKQIPFPIILDSTFKSWERFGLPGLGTVILIDPDGNLVEGDESTLDRILRN